MRGLLCLILLLFCLQTAARKDTLTLFRLKVEAAKSAGLDTMSVFRTRTQAYRQEQFMHYLQEQLGDEQQLWTEYEQQRIPLFQIVRIYKYLPQNLPTIAQKRVELQMDSISLCLQNGTLDFATALSRFSDRQDSCWYEPLQMPREWLTVLDTLKQGETSSPFYAPQGLFILKRLGQKFSPSFQEWKQLFLERELRKQRSALLDKLKNSCNYSVDKGAERELLSKGKTERVLFKIGQETYTASAFKQFAAAYVAGTKRQFERFVKKSLLDYVNQQLEILSPKAAELIKKYEETLLVELITKREVIEPSRKDTLGIRRYFETHRKNYRWTDVRYKGIVLRCSDRQLLKQVRKRLKRLPEENWMDYVSQINLSSPIQIEAEYAIFAKGDNFYVDDKIFKVKRVDATPISSYFVLMGKKLKEPEEWKEVESQVISDFQEYLNQCWIARLRASTKVEIDQEDLKTVN